MKEDTTDTGQLLGIGLPHFAGGCAFSSCKLPTASDFAVDMLQSQPFSPNGAPGAWEALHFGDFGAPASETSIFAQMGRSLRDVGQGPKY